MKHTIPVVFKKNRKHFSAFKIDARVARSYEDILCVHPGLNTSKHVFADVVNYLMLWTLSKWV